MTPPLLTLSQILLRSKGSPGFGGDASSYSVVRSSSGSLDFSDLSLDSLWRLLEVVSRRGKDGDDEDDVDVVVASGSVS